MKEEETSGAKGCFVPNSLWVSFMAMIIFCSQLIEAEQTHPSEVEAMRAVRESLVDPMKYLVSWNKKDPCTDKWECVACYDKVGDDGYWHIKEIQLLERNLSGSLSPELGKLGHLEIMDFMWNQIEGSIPKEIGSITSLRLLLLNGNRLSGTLPDELGNLSNLDRFQIDENFISGPLPKSLANMTSLKHMHMNNNSISGQIPPELARLPMLVHLLLDNNNLSGYLPPEFSASQTLTIIQLDNNNFSGSEIPGSYNNISTLVKLSLRNCSLQGTIPDFSRIPMLTYLDLSWNKLEGFLPTNRISNNITTIDFSYNKLTGSIPTNLSGLPALQKLSLRNNTLNGSFPFLWKGISFDPNATLILDFRNNFLSGNLSFMDVPVNVTIMLEGNPVCSSAEQSSLLKFCSPLVREVRNRSSTEFSSGCPLNSCPKEDFYDYIPASPEPCYCAAPIRVGYRLKSPGFSDFAPYLKLFEKYLSFDLELSWYQVSTDSFDWEEGPRLRMYLKIFPNLTRQFNVSEVMRIRGLFAGWEIHNRDIFGPYELLNFTLLGPYSSVVLDTPSSGWSKQAIIGAILGTVTGAIILSIIVSFIIVRSKMRHRYKHQPRIQCEGVKSFTFKEIAKATNNFSDSAQIGRGGFGKVYKATLSDGTVVAVKRASEGSLQGSKEFCTEIELLSRLHHRNLVSLVGYCDEEAEQMLIYEFMSNGTLLDHLSSFSKNSLDFFLRLRIALDSAKGILYLHTEADPPILHRDIKAVNILLDSRFTAKVADFGLSRLAPTSDEGVVFGHVSTVVKGTPGYLDPEYFLTQKLTDKSDVYSLGVVFLELWTGLRAISLGKNIVREVRTAYESGSAPSILDKRMSSYPPHALGILLSLALRCCNEDMEKRPTMQEVVRELETAWQMALDAKGAPSQMVDVESLTDQRRSRTDEASSEPCSSQMPNVPESDVWVEVFPR